MVELLEKIENYPNYSVSNLGRVRSDRKDLILKPCICKEYEMVLLYNEKGRKMISVHHLVHDAFCGGGRKGREIIINHLDEFKLNNLLFNLELSTPRNNTIYSIDKTKTSSKYIGVSYHKLRKKLWAYTFDNLKKRRICVGYYPTEELAYEALEKYKNNIKND